MKSLDLLDLYESLKLVDRMLFKMNGPQRTACLAKGCINNQYQLAIARQWASSDKRNTEHGRTDIVQILRLASSFARQQKAKNMLRFRLTPGHFVKLFFLSS